MRASSVTCGPLGWANLVRADNGSKIEVRLDLRKQGAEIPAMRLAPGKWALTEFGCISRDEFRRANFVATTRPNQPIATLHAKAGETVYIGDFHFKFTAPSTGGFEGSSRVQVLNEVEEVRTILETQAPDLIPALIVQLATRGP